MIRNSLRQGVQNACMPTLMVLLLQVGAISATRLESQDDNVRTTRAYWLKDAYVTDVAAAIENQFKSAASSPRTKPAIAAADTAHNVLFVDVVADEIAQVDRLVRKLDARPATLWLHCQLSVESPADSKILSRPVLCCMVGNRKSTVTVGSTQSDEQHRIEARARKLDGSTVEVDITLSSKVESTDSRAKRTTVTHSVRSQETVQLDRPVEIKLSNHADRERYAKLIVTVRKSDEH